MSEGKPMVVTHDGGVRFVTEIRGHEVAVDQPPEKGGDSAPKPIELLGAALGTCVAFYVQQYCQSRELPYEDLRVEVEQHSERNPARVGRFDVRVLLPHALPANHLEMLQRVAKSCPVHNTLAPGAEIGIWLEVPAAAPAARSSEF
jgi:putative redox protein